MFAESVLLHGCEDLLRNALGDIRAESVFPVRFPTPNQYPVFAGLYSHWNGQDKDSKDSFP